MNFIDILCNARLSSTVSQIESSKQFAYPDNYVYTVFKTVSDLLPSPLIFSFFFLLLFYEFIEKYEM